MATKTVKKGDTFSTVSKKNSVPEEDLRQENPGVQTLKPGQVIRIPRPRPLPDEGDASFRTPTINGSPAPAPSFAGSNLGGGTVKPPTSLADIQTPKDTVKIDPFLPGVGIVKSNATPGYNPAFAGGNAGAGGTSSAVTYQTGEGERKTVTLPDGRRVNIPPNTTYNYNPNQPNSNVLQNMWNTLTGQGPAPEPSGSGSVRGSVPTNRKVPGLASPAQQINPFAGGSVGGGGRSTAPQTNLGMYNNSPYNGFQTPTSSAARLQPVYTGTAGYWAQQPKPSQANFQTPTTNGFQTPFLGSSSYLDPRWQQGQQGQQSQQQPAKLQRPTGVFTGDPNDPNTALWRNYWNAQAENPGLYANDIPAAAQRVMTREEIWEMKANQRRAGMQEEPQNTGGNNAPLPAPATTNPPAAAKPPFLSRNIVWGI